MTPKFIGERFAVLQPQTEKRGGTALVYKAIDTWSPGGRQVAVKVFDAFRIADGLLHEIFLRETEALSLLKHPSIVEMIASGKDKELDRYYVALEWLEDTLENSIQSQVPEGWDSFAESVLLPLLDGLAFAHRRGVWHRDIKPANILIGRDGPPRLADFGLAKIIHSLREGQTVREFRSLPYSAPEMVTNAPDSARADLFSLGITILRCLAPEFAITHGNIPEAISRANVPDIAEDFLRRLTSLDPAKRPVNAEVALIEYKELQRRRPRDASEYPRYHLLLPPAVQTRAFVLLDVPDGNKLRRKIADDLARRASIRFENKSGKNKGENYSLLGDELAYHVAPDLNEPGRLRILSVTELPTSLLEHLRDRHAAVDAVFTFDAPLNPTKAKNTLSELLNLGVQCANDQRILDREREEAELFRQWRDIIEAKEEAEMRAADALEFESFAMDGENIRFHLVRPVSDEEIGSRKRILTRDRMRFGKETLSGMVEDATGKDMVLHLSRRTDKGRIPTRGLLVPDFTPSIIALKRQRRALDAIQHENSLRPELRRLLLYPREAGQPAALDLPPLFHPDLDEPKKEALKVAYNAPDLTAVQGPPGTGKTTWIAELACQFLRQKRGRILLSGQTHIAVDNALEKIKRLSPDDVKIVRVGSPEKISEKTEEYRVETQMDHWRTQIRRRAEAWMERRVAEEGLSAEQLILTGKYRALQASIRAHQKITKELEGLREREVDLSASQEAPTITDQLASVVQKIADAEETETVLQRRIADAQEEVAVAIGQPELGSASADELHQAIHPRLGAVMERAENVTKLQSLQEEWFLRFGAGPGFREALLLTADIVAGTCIGIAGTDLDQVEFELVVIDEASKATPTEALTPMVRGKRWVLVGDQKQLPPFADDSLDTHGLLEKYNLTRESLRATLFDRLVSAEGLPETCRPKLTTQHRMVRAIGQLISACFYEGLLASARKDPPHRAIRHVLDRPVTWFSTSSLPGRRERSGRGVGQGAGSYVNAEEAEQIHRWLTELNRAALKEMTAGAPALKVGIISGYAAQKDHLIREIVPRNRKRWQGLEMEINSVDAFQGREVDVLVYSVTRSNREGRLGFVRFPHRLNVALSRGRDALVIFGDAEHCRRCSEAENAFPRVLAHISAQKNECSLRIL